MSERKAVTKWRPEFLALEGVDGDPWRALLLSQLVWYAAITTKADKWTHQTSGGLRDAIGAGEALSESIVRRKLRQLEDAGLIESREGWQRRKEYRPALADEVVGAAYESARGASHVVQSRGPSEPQFRPPEPEFQKAEPEFQMDRNHSSDGRNCGSDARTEESLEVLLLQNAHARPDDWRQFPEWLLNLFAEHERTLSPAISDSLSMQLAELCGFNLDEAVAYVRQGVMNMSLDGGETTKIVRALQKRQHLDKFREDRKSAVALVSAQGNRVITPETQDEMDRALDEIYGGSDD